MESIGKINLIDMNFNNHLDLKNIYIPFIKKGGLFLNETHGEYRLGDYVKVQLNLIYLSRKFEFLGKIIWKGTRDLPNIMNNIGIEFLEEDTHAGFLALMNECFNSTKDPSN